MAGSKAATSGRSGSGHFRSGRLSANPCHCPAAQQNPKADVSSGSRLRAAFDPKRDSNACASFGRFGGAKSACISMCPNRCTRGASSLAKWYHRSRRADRALRGTAHRAELQADACSRRTLRRYGEASLLRLPSLAIPVYPATCTLNENASASIRCGRSRSDGKRR